MKTIEVNNIFSKIPKSFPKEIFNTIASSNKGETPCLERQGF